MSDCETFASLKQDYESALRDEELYHSGCEALRQTIQHSAPYCAITTVRKSDSPARREASQ
jgi:hypothetical protein